MHDVRDEAALPEMPFQPDSWRDNEIAVLLSGAYMREGAMLLSDKDFPLFAGAFQPGFAAGARTRIELGSVVDFALTPAYVYQSGTDESLTALHVPTSLIVALGSLVKVSADVGVFTGDDFSLRGSNGGRVTAGGALDVKIGPIIAHAGAGVASLLTGGAYPTIRDSLYVDLNVEFAR